MSKALTGVSKGVRHPAIYFMANQRKEGVKQVAGQFPPALRELKPEGVSITAWLMVDTVRGALGRKKITLKDVEQMERDGDLTHEACQILRREGILK
jgi:hypothetical protein